MPQRNLSPAAAVNSVNTPSPGLLQPNSCCARLDRGWGGYLLVFYFPAQVWLLIPSLTPNFSSLDEIRTHFLPPTQYPSRLFFFFLLSSNNLINLEKGVECTLDLSEDGGQETEPFLPKTWQQFSNFEICCTANPLARGHLPEQNGKQEQE